MRTISCCMIVKNEERVLARVLDAVAKFSDEIVIVDTGSVDDTIVVASKYTKNIYSYKWNDNFSRARNYAISKCTMDYFMWLDADDVVPDKTIYAILSWKKSSIPCDIVMLRYDVAFDSEDKCTFSYFRERILNRNKGYKFTGYVHECITPYGEILYMDYPIEHRKLGAGDPDRNLNIYKKMIEKHHKFSPREKYYYANELYYHGYISDATKYYLEVLNDSTAYVENRISAANTLCDIFKSSNEILKSRQAILYSFGLDIPRCEGLCKLAETYYSHGDFRRAAYWYRIATITDDDTNNGAFHKIEYDSYIPNIMLGLCYYYLGDYVQAYKYNMIALRSRPDDPSALNNKELYLKKMQEKSKK